MKNKPLVCAIVAVGPDNVIGQGGVMPWNCKSDLYHFKHVTMSWPCIFGRTTYEHLPIAPLPGRLNVVCGSGYKNQYQDGVFYANSIEAALKECSGYKKVFICGGAQIYKYAFDKDLVDVLYLTVVENQKLEYDIRKNPNSYCRFQPDVSVFFNSPMWFGGRVNYPTSVLPKDMKGTVAKFYKFNKVR